jgi:hypothetical protein
MNDHPLGVPTPDDQAQPVVDLPSIVDTILDLDAFLSGDVRRAERTARFATKPDLEADIDELDALLDNLTDAQGRPLKAEQDGEPALGDSSSTSEALTVATQIKDLQAEYAASFRSIRLRQMPDDDWDAFQIKHKDTLAKGAPYPKELLNELIVASAIAPTVSDEQIKKLRKKIGAPQISSIAGAAWQVNTESGVSVPKSPLSSRVLRQQERETN